MRAVTSVSRHEKVKILRFGFHLDLYLTWLATIYVSQTSLMPNLIQAPTDISSFRKNLYGFKSITGHFRRKTLYKGSIFHLCGLYTLDYCERHIAQKALALFVCIILYPTCTVLFWLQPCIEDFNHFYGC